MPVKRIKPENPMQTIPQRVAQNVRRLFPDCSDDVVMAALLHDVIEDCGISETDLRQKNYSPSCIEIVSLVTKNPDNKRNYDEVIDDLVASGNREAMMVKIADNMDNLHPRRVEELYRIAPEKAQRLGERYRKSIQKLAGILGIDKDRQQNPPAVQIDGETCASSLTIAAGCPLALGAHPERPPS